MALRDSTDPPVQGPLQARGRCDLHGTGHARSATHARVAGFLLASSSRRGDGPVAPRAHAVDIAWTWGASISGPSHHGHHRAAVDIITLSARQATYRH